MCGAANLFGGEQFAAEDIVVGGQLWADSGAEQLAENRDEQVAVDTVPAATFEVVQPEFFLGFPEAVFDWSAPEGHAQDLSQRPAVATGPGTAKHNRPADAHEWVSGKN